MKKIVAISVIASSMLFGADFTNSIGLKFKTIPSGTYEMGYKECAENPFDAKAYERCLSWENINAKPSQLVKIKSFMMSETEVTQKQYYDLIGFNPELDGGKNHPVRTLSYEQVLEFVDKLNKKENTNAYRLPTAAEWEYAARAGTNTPFYCGDFDTPECIEEIACVYDPFSAQWGGFKRELDENYQAWKRKGKKNGTCEVKSYKPNKFGLYDMLGNVSEWTSTPWTNTLESDSEKDEYARVVMGGNFNSKISKVLSSSREKRHTGMVVGVGIRLVKDFK